MGEGNELFDFGEMESGVGPMRGGKEQPGASPSAKGNWWRHRGGW